MKLVHHALTDRGRRRTQNEDSVLADADLCLYVVADGMGGHAAGEVASRLAVEAISGYLAAPNGSGPPAADAPVIELPPLAARLQSAILHAHQKIIDASRENRQYRGMATTVVAVLVDGSVAHLAHAGDSRAYLFRANTLRRLTTDHSWVSERIALGELTAEEARTHPLRSMVTRALGGRNELDVEMQAPSLEPGDLLLLCSDGLTSMVAEPDIEAMVRDGVGDVPALAATLVAAANAKGGDDNISVVLLRLDVGTA